jgi:hypothetical protein
MSVSNSGFALRINGTCPVTGVDCGATVAPYRACCPADSFCPSEYNIDVCQISEKHCSTAPMLTLTRSAAPPQLTALASYCKTLNAQINRGIYTIIADTFVVSRGLRDMLSQVIVMGVRSRVMHFRVGRLC